jgi:rhodanese-related sulfurtransferase
MIKQTSVQEINKLIKEGGACQVIDVREYGEFEAEKIQQAKLVPLSNFERQMGEIDSSQPVYLMCRSGNRAKQAAEKLVKRGFSDVHVIESGMLAWSKAGFPTVKGASKVWSLERQVRFAAGSLVVLGVVLSWLIHPYLIALSAFVGAGLVFAAVTDTCGMAMMLARMPWNKESGAVCETTQKA